MRTVRIKRIAQLQIAAAAKWWKKHRTAAPGLIDIEFTEAIKQLLQYPASGSLVKAARHVGTRLILLPKTRYCVYYTYDDEYFDVVAFWHASRGRGPKV